MNQLMSLLRTLTASSVSHSVGESALINWPLSKAQVLKNCNPLTANASEDFFFLFITWWSVIKDGVIPFY